MEMPAPRLRYGPVPEGGAGMKSASAGHGPPGDGNRPERGISARLRQGGRACEAGGGLEQGSRAENARQGAREGDQAVHGRALREIPGGLRAERRRGADERGNSAGPGPDDRGSEVPPPPGEALSERAAQPVPARRESGLDRSSYERRAGIPCNILSLS